jgi:hypothetical protein
VVHGNAAGSFMLPHRLLASQGKNIKYNDAVKRDKKKKLAASLMQVRKDAVFARVLLIQKRGEKRGKTLYLYPTSLAHRSQ